MTEEQQGAGEHPFWQDLNPEFLAGENYDLQGPHPEKTAPTAFDVKGAHDALQGLSDDELKQISILPPGSRLEQGAVYIDLRDPGRQEFSARGDMTAGRENWFVPKSDTPYWIWNRLIGVKNPERLDQANES
jgi:hypothetical protein